MMNSDIYYLKIYFFLARESSIFPLLPFSYFFQQSPFKNKKEKRKRKRRRIHLVSIIYSFTTHLGVAELHKTRNQSFWKSLLQKILLSLKWLKGASPSSFENIFESIPTPAKKKKMNTCLSLVSKSSARYEMIYCTCWEVLALIHNWEMGREGMYNEVVAIIYHAIKSRNQEIWRLKIKK